MKELERWKEEMPKEQEMGARDKYWFFDRKVRGYRKGVHSKLLLSVPLVGTPFYQYEMEVDRVRERDTGPWIDLAR